MKLKLCLIGLLFICAKVVAQAPIKEIKTFMGNAYVDTVYNETNEEGKEINLKKTTKKFINEVKINAIIGCKGNYNETLKGAYFIKDADFYNINLECLIYFPDVQFIDNMRFAEGNTKYGASFKKTVFYKQAVFSQNQSLLDFKYCDFKETALFIYTKFPTFRFLDCRVEDLVYFNNAIFEGDVEIRASTFRSVVDFTDAQFYGNVDLRGNTFDRAIVFNNAKFQTTPNFDYVNLPNHINFQNVKIESNELSKLEQKLDFRLCKLDSLQKREPGTKCKIQLEGADLSKILLPYSLFQLSFDDATTYEMRTGIYEAIIKTCTDNGMIESAKDWDIEYREFKNRHNLWGPIAWVVNTFNWLWWNFGYSKQRILLFWLPLFFLGFWIINTKLIHYLYKNVYRDDDLGATFRKKHIEQYGLDDELEFQNRNYRIAYAFFYTATIYFGFKLKHEAVNFANSKGMAYLYVMYAVGAIHVAFALSYILNVY